MLNKNSQNSFTEGSHLKLKIGLAATIVTAIFILVAGGVQDFLAGQLIIPRAFENTVPGITVDKNGEIFLSHAGVTINIPPYYSLSPAKENMSEVGLLAYDFRQENSQFSPSFHKIQLKMAPDIEYFFRNCEDTLCYFGELGTEERYNERFSIFPGSDKIMKNHYLLTLNDREYLVTQEPCLKEICSLRRYRTYFYNTRVDLFVKLKENDSAREADSLVEEFGIY